MNEYWQTRVEKIKKEVSMRDLIDNFGIQCQSQGIITQIHCPFHSHDTHASARIFDTNTMYCWVCTRVWDTIRFVKEYKNIEFSEACVFLEDLYGIEKPDGSLAYKTESFESFLESPEPLKEKEFDKDFSRINLLLIRNRDIFSLEIYKKYFYYLDNIFVNYKFQNYEKDSDLQISLDNLYQEISKDL